MFSLQAKAASLVEYWCASTEMESSFAEVARGACLDKGNGPVVRNAVRPIQGHSQRVPVELV